MRKKIIISTIFIITIFLAFLSGCGGVSKGSETTNITDENESVIDITDTNNEVMQLPSGYSYETIYNPKLSGLNQITASKDGTVFVKYKTENGYDRVATVEVSTEKLQKVIDFDSTKVSFIVGGPSQTFLVRYNEEIRQYSIDGSYVLWGENISCEPKFFTDSNKLICFENDSFMSYNSDGTSITIATGFAIDDDIAIATDGTAYIADVENGSLLKVDVSGTKTKLADIAADPTHLAFDNSGNLYINNITTDFSIVDLDTGNFTKVQNNENSCIVKVPADFAIDTSGRVVFATWTDSTVSWFDLDTKEGNALFKESWANTHAITLGSDDALYIAVNGCDSSSTSKVIKVTLDGTSSTYLDGIVGNIEELNFDSAGTLYLLLSVKDANELYYTHSGEISLTKIELPPSTEISSFSIDPTSNNIFATTGTNEISEISTSGIVKKTSISLPKEIMSLNLMFAPNGKAYGYGDEKERWATGPVVERYIFSVDLDTNSASVIAQVDLNHCCPLTNASIDAQGNIWWILNPDFYLYKISSEGKKELFASNTPVDAGSVFRTSKGDILLNHPGGIMRIYSH